MTTDGTAPREERRVITVLFADLVGFTERSEQLDPEDVRALLTRYYASLKAELEAHGGVVDKFIGDAVMAVFGAPVAHEDDPERAVRAALAIRDWARSQDEVSLRIGVNTGEALVALEPAESGLGMVAGDMVNTASRMPSAAPTDGVLVGEWTHRATREIFAYEEREPVVAKGKSEPLRVWEPLDARVSIGARRLGHAPLVGRARELELLRAAFDRARSDGEPQLVTLVGVPGIGKTRLVRELERIAAGGKPPASWLEGRSLPYGAGTSFWGLAEMVKAHAGIMETDAAAEAESKLRSALEQLAADPSDARWLEGHLRPLVGLGGERGPRDDGQAEALVAWRRFFELVASRGPLVLVFDDLHWADDAVLAFVDDLVANAVALPLLVVATARPELLHRRPDWGGGKTNGATISLAPATDADTMKLVSSLAGGLDLDRATEKALLERAGGNPLHAEEFVRMAGERDTDAALPDTVQGIIAARLDVLAPAEKELGGGRPRPRAPLARRRRRALSARVRARRDGAAGGLRRGCACKARGRGRDRASRRARRAPRPSGARARRRRPHGLGPGPGARGSPRGGACRDRGRKPGVPRAASRAARRRGLLRPSADPPRGAERRGGPSRPR